MRRRESHLLSLRLIHAEVVARVRVGVGTAMRKSVLREVLCRKGVGLVRVLLLGLFRWSGALHTDIVYRSCDRDHEMAELLPLFLMKVVESLDLSI
jgi:hypothetical protein